MLQNSYHLVCRWHTLQLSQLFPICPEHSSQSHTALAPAQTKAKAPLKSNLLGWNHGVDLKAVCSIPLSTALHTSQSHTLEEFLLLSPEESNKTAILSKRTEFTADNPEQS